MLDKLKAITTARSHGIKMPVRAWLASRKAGIPYSVACAFLMQETGGGVNEYGHDPGWFSGAGQVTRANYATYKAGRAAHGMQGVGPMQLTYYTIQDQADAAGGCWRAYINMLTGFRILKGYFDTYKSWHDAAYHYNGSGPAAQQYADQVQGRITYWYNLFN